MKSKKKKAGAMDDLKKLRKLVDLIDSELVNLISARQQLAEAIGKLKKQNKISIKNPLREQVILDRTTSIARKKKLDDEFVKKIFKLIIKHSRKIQAKA